MISSSNQNILSNEVKKYLAFLQFEKRLSSNTISSYWFDLKHYSEYLELECKISRFSKITYKILRLYIKNLSSYSFSVNDEISASSLNRKISCIKGFHKHLSPETMKDSYYLQWLVYYNQYHHKQPLELLSHLIFYKNHMLG